MNSILIGCLSALFLGIADFIASQNSKKIGSLHSLIGMLIASSLVITFYLLFKGTFDNFFLWKNIHGISMGILHGILMAIALLLFFHALAIGKISIVSPIMAAHPVFVICFFIFLGKSPTFLQMLAITFVIIGVVIIGASGKFDKFSQKTPHNLNKILKISIFSSILYAVALIALQHSAFILLETNVLWLGRFFGLITVFLIFIIRRNFTFKYNIKWWLIFLIHGFLDSAGLLFIIIGTSGGVNDAILIVIASTFPVITMFLAWLILKETITFIQKLGVLFIIISISYLSLFTKI